MVVGESRRSARIAAFLTVLGVVVSVGLWFAWRKETVTSSDVAGPPSEDAVEIRVFSEWENSGVRFHHGVETPSHFFPEIMGPGGAVLDYDRDGDLDLYLVNGARGGASEACENRLYMQEDGTFRDVTERSGTGDLGFGMGVATGDVNNDGYPDIYVCNYGQDVLFVNRKDGTFDAVSQDAGLDNPQWAVSACFVDINRDGRLDLYVANYVDYDPSRDCRNVAGQPEYCGPLIFPASDDRLFLNVTTVDESGSVQFRDASQESGIASKAGPSLGVIAADVTGDGWADLYVANDKMANFLWVNRTDSTFRDEAVLRAVAFDAQGAAQGGMGLAWGDVNADARPDLFVTNFAGESNTLYEGGDRGFRDASATARLTGFSFAATGFGAALVDLEHDGDLDLCVANGRTHRTPSAANTVAPDVGWTAYAEQNHLLINAGDGRFEPVSHVADDFVGGGGVSRGLATGDFDADGDIDLLVTNTGSAVQLFRNDTEKRGHWLHIEARDPRFGDRYAYGAVITVVGEEGGRWQRLVTSAGSYASASDPRAHFGIPVDAIRQIDVLWPDGKLETFPPVSLDQVVSVRRGAATPNEKSAAGNE